MHLHDLIILDLQRVLHRDIKPSNILLESGSGRVWITDFGLVQIAEESQLTQPGAFMGTPEFCSPEQGA